MHRSDFTGRTTSDVKKSEQFIRAAALEAFGDVIRDGERSALHLIAQASVATEGFVTGEGIGSPGELNGRLPHGEIFEAFIFHGVPGRSSDLKYQIADCRSLTSEICDLKFEMFYAA
jgi:hypothetical protein